MRKIFLLFLLTATSIVCFACGGGVPMSVGEQWLSNQTGDPSVNVDGDWIASEWGKMTFKQCEGCREVSGSTEDGWNIRGVVTGNSVSLLFFYEQEVDYSAILHAKSEDELIGSYMPGVVTDKNAQTLPIQLKKW
jgi:hypothetical protein